MLEKKNNNRTFEFLTSYWCICIDRCYIDRWILFYDSLITYIYMLQTISCVKKREYKSSEAVSAINSGRLILTIEKN